ncbi:hypothetical protein JIM95_009470 [Corynebacterium sp. CCM 8835]|uniref:Secreted protein n=1 Tax=Corynebacterium antarcticum TaxID=2800405 RepID=A0A9Q4CDR6_9CORY|nr:hypothetical protein [Corynebacterium antarcticum]MCK7643112.1 hypothetical protein [Corynebacterium antarcticum]MCK7661615.1 hypothetical protein [Corynebacterium antarcticum]MCL0246358.1 hypothetical protein [Corynebacterium antarcticum]MCX7539011.1 hypothetical protein [Corynebacterium antarcticum]MCX7540955.1 hypothetical protein [Corynebacterium antarcticum]
MTSTTKNRTLIGVLAASALLLGACGADPSTEETPSSSGETTPPTTNAEHRDGESDGEAGELAESRRAQPRIAVAHEGGITVLDAGDPGAGTAPAVIADLPEDGYLRLNRAGDDRHVFVSTPGGFRVLDIGSYSQSHGDHSHHFAGDPSLLQFTVDAVKPGHVVGGEGHAVLFDDKTGTVTDVDLGGMTVSEQFTLPPHHGIAVRNEDGTYVATIADDDAERIGIAEYDASGSELKRFEQCPGAHGAAEAGGGAVVVGCTDGALIHRGDGATKATSPDPYGRIATQVGNGTSRFVLGDYKSDQKAAEEERREHPTRVSIIDVETGELRLVDLGTSYTFRSLAMTDDGTAVVLGTDGKLHLIDPGTASEIRTIDVLEPWEEPDEWQEPRPALAVAGNRAYVTDPAAGKLHAVVLTGGTDPVSVDLPATPDEIVATKG